MISLQNTHGNAVEAAIEQERRRIGASATGMVLTLLVIAEEARVNDAIRAATGAAREHPMRILVFVPRGGRGAGRIDAEISVGGDQGPGELAVLRLRGEVAKFPDWVAIPLLLPDTPVVSWWAGHAPEVPAADKLGRHSMRRITDTSVATRQVKVIQDRAAGYSPGDTDLAWGQMTGWRALLASAFDEPFDTVVAAEVTAAGSAAAAAGLLAAWLHCRLGVPVAVRQSRGPGLTSVRVETRSGDISIRRPAGTRGFLARPNRPEAVVALPRREKADVLAEELRRLDADEIYGETLASLQHVQFVSRSRA